jgi:glutathione S-transferase
MLKFAQLMWNGFLNTIMDVCRAMLMPMERHMDVKTHPTLKLTYFDIEGLAQASRNTLEYGDISFEDIRVSKEEFDVLKTSLPYGQVPVLTVDEDTRIAQSKTILRYVSKLSRTYPRNALNAALIDQWTDLHSEFLSLLAINMYPAKHGLDQAGYDAHTHRQFILRTHIPKYLQLLEDELAHKEDTWLGGMNAISMADMAWYPTLEWMQNEKFTGFTANDMDGFPAVCKYLDEMRNQIRGAEITAGQKETELDETDENPENLECKKNE